jgi:hypothetical protein
MFVDGKLLPTEDGKNETALRAGPVSRVLNVHYKPDDLSAGPHAVELECIEAGSVGLDYIWVRDEAANQ